MKSYDELKSEKKTIQQQVVEGKKKEYVNALTETKRLCKEFDFTAGLLKANLLKDGIKSEICRN